MPRSRQGCCSRSMMPDGLGSGMRPGAGGGQGAKGYNKANRTDRRTEGEGGGAGGREDDGGGRRGDGTVRPHCDHLRMVRYKGDGFQVVVPLLCAPVTSGLILHRTILHLGPQAGVIQGGGVVRQGKFFRGDFVFQIGAEIPPSPQFWRSFGDC